MGMVKITLNAVPTYADNVYFENESRVTTISLDGASGDNVVVYCPIYWQAGALSVSLRDASNHVIMKKSTTVPYNQAGKLYALKPVGVPSYTVAGEDGDDTGGCFVVDWAPDDTDNDMVFDPADGLYKKTLQNVPSWIAFKVVQDHAWGNPDWGDTSTLYGNYEHITTKIGGDIIIKFNAETGAITVEEIDSYTIAGSSGLCGDDWKVDVLDNAMTSTPSNVNVYYKKFTDVEAGDYSFKIVRNRSWSNSNWGGDGDNFEITTTVKGDVEVYFYLDIPSIKVVQNAFGYVVAGSSSDLFGTSWDYHNSSNKMTRLDDGTYSITYPTSSNLGEVEFKVVRVKDSDATYESWHPNDNCKVNVTGAGEVTITYNPTAHSANAVFTPGS